MFFLQFFDRLDRAWFNAHTEGFATAEEARAFLPQAREDRDWEENPKFRLVQLHSL